MFRISDFSRLTRVSVKTLHYYDEIGLFKPGYVDPVTGYRYYSFEQLPRLNHVLVLKGIGLSLDQIARMLDSSPTSTQLLAILRAHETALEHQIKDTQERLSAVKAYIQLTEEGNMSDIQVLIKPVESVAVAGAREIVPQNKMREGCIALHSEIMAYMRRHELKSISPSLALYHDSRAEGIDVEMAYYIARSDSLPTPEGKAHVYTLPTVSTMASAIYHGSYDAFEAVSQVYTAIGQWVEAHGYRLNGASRELYLQPPDWSTVDRIGVMEIQFPVEK